MAKRIILTVSDAQHTAVKQLAKAAGMSMSAYTRLLFERAAADQGADWPADLPGAGQYERTKTSTANE